ncbi:hypothetical protein [Bradyrhizobium sp. STM 3557]|uniref:hypothetical protein n=1 Tax=Bradyrhizobium sp. STM 3557 TaxID=578920 RepID=UPI00388DCA40
MCMMGDCIDLSFWVYHGWIITAVVYAIYVLFALALAWLLRCIVFTHSKFAALAYVACAAPLAVALIQFALGNAP